MPRTVIASDTHEPLHAARPGAAQWLRRAGIFGFMFFLLKGLAWLAAPLILLESCTP